MAERKQRRSGLPPGKRWAGRFEKATDPLVEAYTSSIEQDARMIAHDIRGSIAHAEMLGAQGIIDPAEAAVIVAGLQRIAADAAEGTYVLRSEFEDVHMNVETELQQRIGTAAGRLHTARSRNDQVITDFRLVVRDAVDEILALLAALRHVIVNLAEAQLGAVMPGYTHLQLAQPILLSHHLMAYWQMFQRDAIRFTAVRAAANESPLGSGALAGLPYPLDRQGVAGRLGFARITQNSLDAVSNRDFVIELHAAASICMMHFSRLSEELILWSTREFGFITLDDAFATGSSIMPQKKNPDIAELARGRTGRVYGNLVAALTMMKALPLAYNRDLQEDKAPIFDSVDTLAGTIAVFTAMLPTITWHTARMRAAAGEGYSLATDFADYLVRKGLPFREAHTVVGNLVKYAEAQNKQFGELTLAEYQRFSPLFDESVLHIDLDTAVNERDVEGGTARRRVAEQIARAHAQTKASNRLKAPNGERPLKARVARRAAGRNERPSVAAPKTKDRSEGERDAGTD